MIKEIKSQTLKLGTGNILHITSESQNQIKPRTLIPQNQIKSNQIARLKIGKDFACDKRDTESESRMESFGFNNDKTGIHILT